MHKTFPSKESVEKIHALGVNYIVIDKTTFDKEFMKDKKTPAGSTVVSLLKSYKNIKFIKNVENYTVFSIDEKK